MTDEWTDGKQIRVFESGPILEYLVERYDKDNKVSYPKDSREYWEVKSWVRTFHGAEQSSKSRLSTSGFVLSDSR